MLLVSPVAAFFPRNRCAHTGLLCWGAFSAEGSVCVRVCVCLCVRETPEHPRLTGSKVKKRSDFRSPAFTSERCLFTPAINVAPNLTVNRNRVFLPLFSRSCFFFVVFFCQHCRGLQPTHICTRSLSPTLSAPGELQTSRSCRAVSCRGYFSESLATAEGNWRSFVPE